MKKQYRIECIMEKRNQTKKINGKSYQTTITERSLFWINSISDITDTAELVALLVNKVNVDQKKTSFNPLSIDIYVYSGWQTERNLVTYYRYVRGEISSYCKLYNDIQREVSPLTGKEVYKHIVSTFSQAEKE